MAPHHIGFTRWTGSLLLAVTLVGTVWLTAPSQSVGAGYGDPGVIPSAGQWCGLSDSGDAVRFRVTADSRFVTNIRVFTGSGGIDQSESSSFPKVQVKDSKWILKSRLERRRGPGGGRGGPSIPICRSVPCDRGGGSNVGHQYMVRGTFRSPDQAVGYYTMRGARSRAVGRYSAWPQALAPCP